MFSLMNAIRGVLFILDTGKSVNEGATLLICQPLLIFIVCLSCDLKCPHPTMELPAVYLLPIPPLGHHFSNETGLFSSHACLLCVETCASDESIGGLPFSECLMLPFAPVVSANLGP